MPKPIEPKTVVQDEQLQFEAAGINVAVWSKEQVTEAKKPLVDHQNKQLTQAYADAKNVTFEEADAELGLMRTNLEKRNKKLTDTVVDLETELVNLKRILDPTIDTADWNDLLALQQKIKTLKSANVQLEGNAKVNQRMLDDLVADRDKFKQLARDMYHCDTLGEMFLMYERATGKTPARGDEIESTPEQLQAEVRRLRNALECQKRDNKGIALTANNYKQVCNRSDTKLEKIQEALDLKYRHTDWTSPQAFDRHRLKLITNAMNGDD